MTVTFSTDAGRAVQLQRRLLIITTAIAVVSDAMLIPFYPKFFKESFGVASSTHVGLYLAATCLTVMVALPLWAHLEKRIGTLPLLVMSQLGAGLLSLACFRTTDIIDFWLLSLGMVVFKASYLLVYPYLLRLEPKAGHAGIIGLLTVILHLGGIAGAVAGGWVVDQFAAQHAFVGMAMGDLLQMGACIVLLFAKATPPIFPEDNERALHPEAPSARRLRLAKLGGIMLTLYLAAFVIRPFFVQYWQSVSPISGALLSGWIFSIPAWMALLCLAYQRRVQETEPPAVQRSLALCCVGLIVTCIPHEVPIVCGLAIFGWSAFRVMVHMDVLIFHLSPPESYAADFSRMNFCQQLGALAGFYIAGYSVATGGLVVPLVVACGGFALTAVLYQGLFATSQGEPESEVMGGGDNVAFDGELELSPLKIPEDMSVIHGWVSQDYARYWGMQGMTLDEVVTTYEEVTSPQHVFAFLGRHDGTPAFLMETYHPLQTPLNEHYKALPTDRGMHILVAPTDEPIHGFTRRVFFAVMDFIFSDESVERVVVEPDTRNEKIRALNRLAGFEELRELELSATATTPAKRAMFSVCTRQSYSQARRRVLQ